MILTGLARLGADAELRYTPQNEAVCNLRLAYNYGKKVDGKRPTQWVEASLWGKRAESLAQYLVKGAAIDVVINEVHVEEFDGRNGKGVKLVGRVLDIELAGGRSEQSGERSASTPAQNAAPSKAGSTFADIDDGSDIPF